MNKCSKLFCPKLVIPKNGTINNVSPLSRSQRLMIELGLVKTSGNGLYQIMPLAQRAMDKCIEVVNRVMKSVDGQKITLPILTPAWMWKKSGRLDGNIEEFYMVRDRQGREHILSPTHEEAVAAMLATIAPISYRQMPLRLYQIGPKFRDELKARFGMLRTKEFLMKDMYTFDCTEEDALNTYRQINDAYATLFERLQLPTLKVRAESGMMGGSVSHEYHLLTSMGEDRIVTCKHCDYAISMDEGELQITTCPACATVDSLEVTPGIEIAHSFLLGDKYSKPLGATYLNRSGKPQPLIMGCYGIGISRLVAAALEKFSTDQALYWPKLIAPFDVCVIGPKSGSKEQEIGDPLELDACRTLLCTRAADDFIQDDRKHMTVGKRIMEAKRMGYPMIMVFGSKVLETVPRVELHLYENILELELNSALDMIADYEMEKTNLIKGKSHKQRKFGQMAVSHLE